MIRHVLLAALLPVACSAPVEVARMPLDTCPVVGVERTDYMIHYTTSGMPDVALNGLKAKLEVRRLKPVLEGSSGPCRASDALVMVHGRTSEAMTTFDFQHPEQRDYSFMEGVALRGIDTFAVNMLGYGLSRIQGSLDPMADACNASLPTAASQPTGLPPSCYASPCVPVAGVCDCGSTPSIDAADQQGSTRYLNPNPLAQRCAHTSSKHLHTTPLQVADLDRVIEDVKARTGGARINLLGYSAGGETAGAYLDNELRRAKIARAIFLASLFLQRASEPPAPSWPLAVIDGLGGFNLRCPGQLDTAARDLAWSAMKAHEPVASAWGPLVPSAEDPTILKPAGLSRYPIVARWGWYAQVARRIDTPILAMIGTLDTTASVPATESLYLNSPQQAGSEGCETDASCQPGYICEKALTPSVCRLNNRILKKFECTSHPLFWESAHVQVQDEVAGFILGTP